MRTILKNAANAKHKKRKTTAEAVAFRLKRELEHNIDEVIDKVSFWYIYNIKPDYVIFQEISLIFYKLS